MKEMEKEMCNCENAYVSYLAEQEGENRSDTVHMRNISDQIMLKFRN